MNQYVPEFTMDEDYIPTNPSLSRISRPEDEIMELLWHNGGIVARSQNQRASRKSPPPPKSTQSFLQEPRSPPPPPDYQPAAAASSYLFMQEDEMASWLHLPVDEFAFDRDIYGGDLLYPPPPPSPATASTASLTLLPEHDVRPAVTPAVQPSQPHKPQSVSPPPVPPGRNFPQSSKFKGRMSKESRPSGSQNEGRELTVVDSSVSPADGMEQNKMDVSGQRSEYESLGGTAAAGTFTDGSLSRSLSRDVDIDTTLTSSSGGSGARTYATLEPDHNSPRVDRKRKASEANDAGTESPGEDVKTDSAEAKKPSRQSPAPKRSRAAVVHYLSERRRRDRINEKMKALKELIPHCTKTDKASMLDEAIDYLKTLQLQVQMMSMGCGMLPMMFPGVHHHVPPVRMGMGIGMGMGMGMDMGMGMNQPMMPFPSILAGSAMPVPGPRFAVPAFSVPPVPMPDPSRPQSSNQIDSTMSPYALQSFNFPRPQIVADPYQQYLSMQQMQVQVRKHQSSSKPR